MFPLKFCDIFLEQIRENPPQKPQDEETWKGLVGHCDIAPLSETLKTMISDPNVRKSRCWDKTAKPCRFIVIILPASL